MSESNLWERIRPKLLKYGDLVRIESHMTAAGIPDLNYCFLGCEGWIELKFAKQPARAATVVFKSQRGLDPEQVSWLLNRRRCGGRAFVLIQLGKWLLLIDGKYAAKINVSTTDQLIAMSTWKRSGAVREKDYDELAERLRFS